MMAGGVARACLVCDEGRRGGREDSSCQGGVAGGVIMGARPESRRVGGERVEVREEGEGGGAEEEEEREEAALSAW